MRACTLAFFLDLESDWLNHRNSSENMREKGEKEVFFLGCSKTNVLFRFFIFYFLL